MRALFSLDTPRSNATNSGRKWSRQKSTRRQISLYSNFADRPINTFKLVDSPGSLRSLYLFRHERPSGPSYHAIQPSSHMDGEAPAAATAPSQTSDLLISTAPKSHQHAHSAINRYNVSAGLYHYRPSTWYRLNRDDTPIRGFCALCHYWRHRQKECPVWTHTPRAARAQTGYHQ